MKREQPLGKLAEQIARLLVQSRRRIVFAESCTAGLISATLGRVPGISEHHCGSAVVYRLATKSRWLGVPEELLINPGPVSAQVAEAMATGVLRSTPEADLAAAITGHLGPNSPPTQDGLIYVGLLARGQSCRVFEHRLPGFDPAEVSAPFPGSTEREIRQWAAVEFVLSQLAKFLDEPSAVY